MATNNLNFKTGKECVRALRMSKSKASFSLQEIWSHIKHQKFKLDAVDYTQLLKECRTKRHSEIGHDILQHVNKHLPQPKIDPILLTSIVNMLVKCGDPNSAINLWKESLGADRVLYMSFLMACTDAKRLDVGKNIELHMEKHKFRMEPTVLSCLTRMYTKCNEPEQVKHIWNYIIRNNIRPDATLYTSILTACADWAKKIRIPDEEALLIPILTLGKQIHKHIITSHVRYDCILYNSLMNMYIRTNQSQAAIEIWHEMRKLQVKPNHATFTIALLACAETASLQLGGQICEMLQNQEMDNVLATAAITFFAKSGDAERASKVFLSLLRNNVTVDIMAWNSIISAYSLQGDWDKSYQLFNSMLKYKVEPDSITFTHLLIAASHAGKVDEALKLYNEMNSYNISPNLTHKTVVVDVLSRSGQLQEAAEFIESNIPEPNIITWRTLLGGCRVTGNIEWAEKAAQAALAIDPKSAPVYVMLSNIYAASGRWDDRQRIRTEMEENGIRKIPGRSQIEVDGKIHTFIMRDDTHPELDLIHERIKQMHQDLKKANFKPDTSWVLKNANEEEKEDDLCYHSEKMAMAYGLIHSPPHSKLVITKNLRVCGNCHSSTKMFSKIYSRDIIVRDASRFHHFHDGKCSCGDFW